MKVSLIQMSIGPEKSANLAHARSLIDAAAAGGADMAVLPEMFCCEYRNKSFVANRESAGGEAWRMLSAAAAENGIYIIGGSLPEEEEEGDKLYNTSFVFGRDGRQIARCRKTHLFDIAVDGGQHFRESATFTTISAFSTRSSAVSACAFASTCASPSWRG